MNRCIAGVRNGNLQSTVIRINRGAGITLYETKD